MTIPLPNNSTALFTDMYIWANNTTDNVLGYGLLLMVFSMVFFGTQRYGATPSHATLVGLTTTTMVCGALTVMGVVSSGLLTMVSIMLMCSYFYTYHN